MHEFDGEVESGDFPEVIEPQDVDLAPLFEGDEAGDKPADGGDGGDREATESSNTAEVTKGENGGSAKDESSKSNESYSEFEKSITEAADSGVTDLGVGTGTIDVPVGSTLHDPDVWAEYERLKSAGEIVQLR